MTLAALMLAVFCCACALDYAHVRYAEDRDQLRAHGAATWSVAQWVAATVGFVVAVRVSLWVLPAEALGLYVGTWIGVQRKAKARLARTCK